MIKHASIPPKNASNTSGLPFDLLASLKDVSFVLLTLQDAVVPLALAALPLSLASATFNPHLPACL